MTGWFQVHTEQTVMQHGLPVGTITEGVPLFLCPKPPTRTFNQHCKEPSTWAKSHPKQDAHDQQRDILAIEGHFLPRPQKACGTTTAPHATITTSPHKRRKASHKGHADRQPAKRHVPQSATQTDWKPPPCIRWTAEQPTHNQYRRKLCPLRLKTPPQPSQAQRITQSAR